MLNLSAFFFVSNRFSELYRVGGYYSIASKFNNQSNVSYIRLLLLTFCVWYRGPDSNRHEHTLIRF